MTEPSEAIDGEVLRLCSGGQGFARIRQDLGSSGPATPGRSSNERFASCCWASKPRYASGSPSRLDRRADKVIADTDMPVEEKTRRLAAVKRFRGRLTTDLSLIRFVRPR